MNTFTMLLLTFIDKRSLSYFYTFVYKLSKQLFRSLFIYIRLLEKPSVSNCNNRLRQSRVGLFAMTARGAVQLVYYQIIPR